MKVALGWQGLSLLLCLTTLAFTQGEWCCMNSDTGIYKALNIVSLIVSIIGVMLQIALSIAAYKRFLGLSI